VISWGDVWLVNLGSTIGNEIRKSRPCVVISPPELNDYLQTIIVAPMTSQGFQAPFRIALTFQGTTGLILLDQQSTIDKSQLIKKLGRLQPKTLTTTLQKLKELFEV
jgi:mRNA interferase MazF